MIDYTVQQSLKDNFSTLYVQLLKYFHINMLFLLNFVHHSSQDPQTITKNMCTL